ncbi:hypothetical protein [Dyadobacter sp.]|uniref:hypothetical protein n=1 Tax=Dyadobacter sp. TaxID=1914288 RepID=UPI003F713C2D
MKKVFIINGGQQFAHSGGRFNKTLLETDEIFFTAENGYELRTWNAPETAFTLPGEFFNQTTVDDGVLMGFHRMNAFLSLQRVDGMHFHDVEKNVTPERVLNYKELYLNHLKTTLTNN